MYLLLKMVLFHCHVRFQGVKKTGSKLTSRWPRVGQTSRCQVCLAFWSRGRWPVELGLGQVLVGRFNTTAGAPKDMGPPIAPYYSLIPNHIFSSDIFHRSWVISHIGGMKECKYMVVLRDLPFKMICLGWYYNDPCKTSGKRVQKLGGSFHDL